jgi:hypothetical protein
MLAPTMLCPLSSKEAKLTAASDLRANSGVDDRDCHAFLRRVTLMQVRDVSSELFESKGSG